MQLLFLQEGIFPIKAHVKKLKALSVPMETDRAHDHTCSMALNLAVVPRQTKCFKTLQRLFGKSCYHSKTFPPSQASVRNNGWVKCAWCAPIRNIHVSSCGNKTIDYTQRDVQLSGNTLSKEESAGLFDFPEFLDALGFAFETKKSIELSKKLVTKIKSQADSPDASIIDHMDQLSNELCRVADLAECIRQVHPSDDVSSAACEASLALNSYVEVLNTDVDLYQALRNLMDSEKYRNFDAVTKRTAEMFMHDFEISGIHLKESTRRKAVKLNDYLLEIGYRFSLNASEPTLVPKDTCLPALKRLYPQDDKHIRIGYIPYHNPDPQIRENGYLLYHGQDEQRLKVFEEMILGRQKLAQLVGYPSFAHRVLKMSMSRTPENVSNFLQLLSDKILPLAKDDVAAMQRIQDSDKRLFKDCTDVLPWDVPLLESKARSLSLPRGAESMKEWFSLECCISGLSHLFKSLFGVRLEVLPVKTGEVWHPSVYKFGFFDEGGHLLGHTYGDLFYRDSKLSSDCHFTIRGGREVATPTQEEPTYQLPVITVCCSIQEPSSGQPALLSKHSVETLFHEMGHALHSMLGRAKYQNITGTRCSTDFAEVPSTVMEFFLSDDRVLGTFAKHHSTGESLPEPLTKSFQLSKQLFSAYHTQVQITNAITDQRFHSDSVFPATTAGKTGWSVDIHRETAQQYSPLRCVPDAAYFLRFHHLCSYGGRYYSYLWSQAVASLIWKSSFEGDPFSRAAGEKYRTMLSSGGGIEPRKLVGDMLGFEPSVEQLVDALHEDIVRKREQAKNLVKN